MKYFYLLLFALIAPILLFAQSNYKPGYIVALNGDTIKGYINYREWDKNPSNVNFKRSLNESHVEEFNVKNCLAFSITDREDFRSYTVHISQDQVDMSNIKQGVDTSYVENAVLLRVLISGKNITLFSYTDNIKTRYYFLANSESRPEELAYRIYYDMQNASLVRTAYTFRNQLQSQALKHGSNNDKLYAQIANAEYFEADLIKIAKEINGDKNTEFVAARHFGFRGYIGISTATGTLGFPGMLKYSDNSSTFPKLVAGCDIFLNKNTKKAIFRFDLSYSQETHSYAYGPDNIGYASTLGDIGIHTFSIAPQIMLNLYNSERFKFFVDAGVSANFSKYSNYQFKEYVNGLLATDDDEFPVLPGFWLNFPVKAGIVIKNRFEFYLGYSLRTTLANPDNTLDGNYTQYQAGINYLFGSK